MAGQDLFGKDWALVTAGPIGKHNSMTISWGSLGILWGKRVITVYVKPARYTHDFIEENDRFVVSFFKEEYRKALGFMGAKSGRDIDKDAAAGLTPFDHDGVTLYKEATASIICRKIYWNDFDPAVIPEDVKATYYETQAPHTIYIGEILEILE